MHGVFIKNGLTDWQILQQEKGKASLLLEGSYLVPKAAIKVGTKSATPMVRVLNEDDNTQLIPWTKADFQPGDSIYEGTWKISLELVAGGLYRIETGLDTVSTQPNLRWIFRGDMRLHIGVGDLFLIAGQSNSAGYGKDMAYDPTSNLVHLYRNRGTWDLACHPLNESTDADCANSEMGVCGTSPYLSFGRNYEKLSHYPVGLIASAMGGQPMKRWDSRLKGDLLVNMLNRVKECGGKIAGILWYQGCSDTSPEHAPHYYERFKHMVEEIRAALGYEVSFFTFQLNRQINGENDACWGMVREAQREAANKIPGVYILPTLNCTLSDGIHNSSSSNVLLGERLAKLCGHVRLGLLPYKAPDLCDTNYSDQIVKLSFRNVQRSFLLNCPKGEWGFTVEDLNGEIKVEDVFLKEEEPNAIHLKLSKVPAGPIHISFGWEANPTMIPPMDEITYLPLLSCYKYRLECN
ncbi:MAG: sialate O-acetylesterase [Lachnospiraceae bacterium]